MKELNKPFVGLLAIIVGLASLNMVLAAPMITKVFVTNFPQNQNVTMTNPPTVIVNVNTTVQPKTVLPLTIVLATNKTIQGQAMAQYPNYLHLAYVCSGYDTYRVDIPNDYKQGVANFRKLDVTDPNVASNLGASYPSEDILYWVFEYGVSNVTSWGGYGSFGGLTDIGQVPWSGEQSTFAPSVGSYLLIHIFNCYNQPQQYSLAVYLT